MKAIGQIYVHNFTRPPCRKIPTIIKKLDFEDNPEGKCLMTDSAFSGKWVANVSGKKPYSAGFSCLLEDISRNGFSVINISFQGKKIKGDGRASLVTAINEGDELCFWSGNPIENQLNNSDWQPVTFQIVIDKNCPSDSKLSIYLFNPGLSEIWMDDLELGFQF